MKKLNFNILLLFFISIFPLIFSSLFLFLKDPQVWPDEAFILDSAKTFLERGVIATNIFGGANPGLEKQALWYPPLYFYTLAFWIGKFGTSIESIRSLSLVLALASLALIFFLLRKMLRDDLLVFCGTFLISVDSSFAMAARMARMEMTAFFFLAGAFLLFYLAEKNQTKNYFLIFLAGVVSALGVLTHPLGFIMPAVLALYILVTSPLKEKVIKIALIAFPVVSLFSLWLFSIRDFWELFLVQYGLQFERKFMTVPHSFILFETDFLWWLVFMLYGIVCYILIVQVWRYKIKRDILIASGLLVSILVLLWGREMWYILYFQPFIAFAILVIIKTSRTYGQNLIKGIAVCIFFMLLVINSYIFINTVALSSRNDYHSYAKEIKKALPDAGNVFLSAIPDPYFELQDNRKLQLFEFLTIPVSREAYRKLLDNCDYIVINRLISIQPDNEKFIADYIYNNTQSRKVAGTEGGYSAEVIKLTPRGKRR